MPRTTPRWWLRYLIGCAIVSPIYAGGMFIALLSGLSGPMSEPARIAFVVLAFPIMTLAGVGISTEQLVAELLFGGAIWGLLLVGAWHLIYRIRRRRAQTN